MRKISSLLLLFAAMFISTNAFGATPTPPEAGTQSYDQTHNLFLEVISSSQSGSTITVHVGIIGLAQYTKIATKEQEYAWNNTTNLVVPGIVETTASGTTLRMIFDGVGKDAYAGHAKLKTVTFQEATSLAVQIGNGAFRNCTSLESVTFNGNKKITFGSAVFEGCSALSTLTFPTTKPTQGIVIGAKCFNACTSLDFCKVNLKGVTDVGTRAFANTASGSDATHRTLTLPSVTQLGSDILAGTQVTALSLDRDANGTINTSATKPEESPFYSIREQLGYIDVMDGYVTGLGDYLFWGCKNAFFEMNTIKSYGKHSMEGCQVFADNGQIYLIGPDVTNIGDSAFFDIEASRVYLPETTPTMGIDVFGAMADGFTYFIIDDDVCDEELAQLYMLEDENENLYSAYQTGRLVQKGPRQTPSFTYGVANAVEYTETGAKPFWSAGQVLREPLCGMQNVHLYVPDKARLVVLNASLDTVQVFPFSHFEYDDQKFYLNSFREVNIPLSSSATEKIKAVYMPELIRRVEVNAILPEVGDPSDGSTFLVTLPAGAKYTFESKGVYDEDGQDITDPTLAADSTYYAALTIVPSDGGKYSSFPWTTPTSEIVDQGEVIFSWNGEAPTQVIWMGNDPILIKEFKTGRVPGAIQNVELAPKATKILRNGQLLIIRDGKEYNVVGAEIK